MFSGSIGHFDLYLNTLIQIYDAGYDYSLVRISAGPPIALPSMLTLFQVVHKISISSETGSRCSSLVTHYCIATTQSQYLVASVVSFGYVAGAQKAC